MTAVPEDLVPAGELLVLDGVLDAGTCARIERDLDYAWWTSSTVASRAADGAVVTGTSDTRVSETTSSFWFPGPVAAEIAALERRLTQRFAFDVAHLEEWQAIRYRPGGRFTAHDDAGLWAAEPAGEREVTLLLYVTAPERGGGTEFPLLDRVVEPRAGRLVVWRNLRPDGRVDRWLRHAALPVEAGRKTIFVTWVRQRPIRPPEEGTASWTTNASSPRSSTGTAR